MFSLVAAVEPTQGTAVAYSQPYIHFYSAQQLFLQCTLMFLQCILAIFTVYTSYIYSVL